MAVRMRENEVGECEMPFLPFPPSQIERTDIVLDQLMRPCGRFKGLLSFSQKMRYRAETTLSRAGLIDNRLTLTEGTPLNWQLLLQYLYEQKLTESAQLHFSWIRTDLPHLYTIRLNPHVETPETDGRQVRRYGFASTRSAEETISRAIGELLERHMLALFRKDDLYRASYSEARARTRNPLDIFSLNDFAAWQKDLFPEFRRSAEAPVSWVEGRRIFDDTPALLPAQLVFWNYKFETGEMVLAQPNTNGCAGHFTRDEAVLSGLLEVIQRDGFYMYWLNGLSPRRIDPSTFVDKEIKDLLLNLRRYNLEYHFLNTTTDVGVPSCTCVLIDQSGGEPIITIGGGTGFSLRDIIFQSAGEALSILRGISDTPATTLPDDYQPFRDRKIGRIERLSLWRGREARDRFSFFLKGKPQSFEAFMGDAPFYVSPRQQLSYIQKKLEALGPGYETYVYEARHPVLSRLGFHAVRVIVPRLMHLYLSEHIPTLAAPRLREVPRKLGYESAKEFTPWPHPFP